MFVSTSTVYGIKYCDCMYGSFEYGLFSNLELALKNYELVKADVINKRYEDEPLLAVFDDQPVDTFAKYAETDRIMIIVYAAELDHLNTWAVSNKDGYFHEWESINDHISIAAYSVLNRYKR